jgi:hypothetical protein
LATFLLVDALLLIQIITIASTLPQALASTMLWLLCAGLNVSQARTASHGLAKTTLAIGKSNFFVIAVPLSTVSTSEIEHPNYWAEPTPNIICGARGRQDVCDTAFRHRLSDSEFALGNLCLDVFDVVG